MKHFSFFFLIAVLSIPSFGNVWRINNNDASADYSTIQSAVDDIFVVLEGDTLMIEGSPLPYGSATLNRRFVIIGPGYLQTENPQTPVNNASAVISGSLEVTAAGCKITGLEFFRNSSTGIRIAANNVIITKCYFRSGAITFFNSDGCIIRQCILAVVRRWNSSYISTNIQLSNCIAPESLNSENLQFSYFENNILEGNSVEVEATYFRNNIVYSLNTNPSSFNIISANLENNLFAGNQIDPNTYPSNVASVDISQLFVQNGSTDGLYELAPNSIARGAGFGGTDCGVFGGQFPYVLSGLGTVPVIYDFRTEGIGNSQTGLPVHIKAKSY
ncbi:MAG: hypothetical protein AAFY71_24630 [Bacteroidota bacterium]